MKNKYLLIIMVLIVVMMSLSPIFAEDSETTYNNSSTVLTNDNNHSVLTNDYASDVDNDILRNNGSSNTYYVNSSEDNQNQMSNPTIQETINNASAGDTIIIKGDFEHVHLVIDKQLTIIGNSSSLSACPSRTTGSGSTGIFYLSPEASGTIISGFTLENSGADSSSYAVRPYGIYVNGASNVRIENCSIKTYDGYGILVNNSHDDRIFNVSSTTLYNTHRTNTGINISKNCSNIIIEYSNINSNGFAGIVLESGDNISITNNYIMDNRNNKNLYSSTIGYGIFVDSPVNGVYIKGNVISSNGNYGVFNNYRANNLNATNEIIDNNLILDHLERAAYTIRYIPYEGGSYIYNETTDTYVNVGEGNGTYSTAPNVIYLYSNYILGTTCGATRYGYDNSSYDGRYDLVFGDIQQVDKGIYNVSIIRKDTGEIASDLNTYDVVFYLNKKTDVAEPAEGDIYRYCRFVNGTATCDFTNESYKRTGNVITAVGPGPGRIVNPKRLSATFNVSDEDILNPIPYATNITASDLAENYGDNKNISIRLIDENGNPLANKTINVTIGSNNYSGNTDSEGYVYISTNGMAAGNYTVNFVFAGDEDYSASNGSSLLNIINQINTSLNAKDLVKVYNDGKRFVITLVDSNNKTVSGQIISVTVNGKTYNLTTDANGQVSLSVNFKPGTYKITSNFYGNDNYTSSSVVNTIKVGKNPTKIIASDLYKKYKNSKPYVLRLLDSKNKPLANQRVRITVHGKTYTKVTNSKGQVSLAINLGIGKYSIKAQYSGNSYYGSSSKTNKINIFKARTSKLVGSNLVKSIISSKRFTVKLVNSNRNPLAGQRIVIIINRKGHAVKTNSKGIASLGIKLRTGTYRVVSKFYGDSVYASSTAYNTIRINRACTKCVSSGFTKQFKTSKAFVLKLVNSKNQPLPKQKIRITVHGKTYTKVTNSKGQVSLAIDLRPGTYRVTSKFYGSKSYAPSSRVNTVKITRASTKIIASDLTKLYKSSNNYALKLLSSNNRPLVKQKVRISVHGKTYTKVTNSKGQVSLAINLGVGKYSIKAQYSGNSYYGPSSKINTINVVKKFKTQLIGSNLNKSYLNSQNLVVKLIDVSNNKPLQSQQIQVIVNGENYSLKTNSKGQVSLAIDFAPENYTATVKYPGTSVYQGTNAVYKIVVNPITTINSSYSNNQIQNILDLAEEGSTIYFADNINGVNLTINKALVLEGGNSTLTGLLNNPVFTINASGVTINDFNIIANNGTGIVLLGDNSIITNNNLNNTLYGDINSYYDGTTLFSGNGIDVESNNNLIENNTISMYYNGVYLKNSNNDSIVSNDIEKNNFGLYYASNVSNTNISSNNISNNIGKIDMNTPEGYYGYGIYANESAVNLTIGKNNIVNNYLGVNFNAANSTGINMYGNLVYNSTVEGVVFWPNYTPVNGEYPTIENNAIFDNAKGPAMFTLGEMSANPNGIYAEGLNDSSKALHIGYNWFGVNKLTTWVQDDNVGAGTMCPRIRANAIAFENLTYVSPGKYNVYFLRNGTLAEDLPDFTMYAYLNDVETTFNVHKGVGTIVFDTSDYLTNETNNIKISSGSIFDSERLFKVIFEYDIPENETES